MDKKELNDKISSKLKLILMLLNHNSKLIDKASRYAAALGSTWEVVISKEEFYLDITEYDRVNKQLIKLWISQTPSYRMSVYITDNYYRLKITDYYSKHPYRMQLTNLHIPYTLMPSRRSNSKGFISVPYIKKLLTKCLSVNKLIKNKTIYFNNMIEQITLELKLKYPDIKILTRISTLDSIPKMINLDVTLKNGIVVSYTGFENLRYRIQHIKMPEKLSGLDTLSQLKDIRSL